MLEKRRTEESENAREWLRAEDGSRWKRIRFLQNGITCGVLNAPGRHQCRRAFVVRSIPDFVQEIVKLRRGRETRGEGDGAEKGCRDQDAKRPRILPDEPRQHGGILAESRAFGNTH